jgi:hypothetical protein
MIGLESVSIGLSFALVCLFFKVYNTRRSIFLLGMPFGFFFLLLSSFFLDVHLIDLTLQTVSPFSSSVMWFRVVTQTLGFVLIAFSYFSAGKYQNTTKHSYLIILSGTAGLIFGAFMILLLVNPLGLESVYSNNEIFAAINLVLLSYILLFLVRKLQLIKLKVTDLIIAPVAFFALWLGQFSFLVFALAGGGNVALVGSQIARVLGFALFIQKCYQASKETSNNAPEQTKQS